MIFFVPFFLCLISYLLIPAACPYALRCLLYLSISQNCIKLTSQHTEIFVLSAPVYGLHYILPNFPAGSPARLHCYQYMMLLNLPVSYDSRHIVECQFFRNHTFHASVRGRRPYGIKDPAASNGVSNLQRCRAAGYLTLAAVAKCLQAATWLVARGNKSKTAHRVGSGSQSPAAHTDNKKGTAPANTECCSLP